MITVRLPAEIRAYKSKLVFGLSVRQILSLVAALVVCIPVGVFGYGRISDDILPWIIMLLAAPILAWGFLTIQDMPFEEYFKSVWKFYTEPQKRVYENTKTNVFVSIREDLMEEEIIRQRVDNGEYENEEVQNWES